MKSLVEYIYEVSKETSDAAFAKASKEVMELSNAVIKDNFKNKELAMKLTKRIRQANVFREYSDKLNAMTAAAVPSSLAKCIKKWKEHGVMIGKTKTTPIFMLSGFDEKEFICISKSWDGDYLPGTGKSDTYWVYPTDKRKRPYQCAADRLKEIVNSDHKILPTTLLVIVPGTEDLVNIKTIESNGVDKRSKLYKMSKDFFDQLMEIKNDIYNELGIKPEKWFDGFYTINRSKMSTPSDWSKLKKYPDAEELNKMLQTNSLDQLFPDKDGVIYISIKIPKDIQSQFDMHGSVLLTKDELKGVELEYSNDGSKDDEANVRKFGRYGRKGDSMHGSLVNGRVKADRYGKEL